MKSSVGIVMAARNAEPYIAEAVRSVLAQTCRDWRLWIIDDGSTDATSRIARRFIDPRIQVVSIEASGQSFAKSLGVRLAAGEWIAFLDADDAWVPTKLETQLRFAANDPAVAVWWTDRLQSDGMQTQAAGNLDSSVLLRANPICFSSTLIHRIIFDELGLFTRETDRSIDYDLWLRIAGRFRFGHVPEPLTFYRTGHANMSANKVARMRAVQGIVERHIRKAKPGKADRVAARASTLRNLGYNLRNDSVKRALGNYWLAAKVDRRYLRFARSTLGVLMARILKP